MFDLYRAEDEMRASEYFADKILEKQDIVGVDKDDEIEQGDWYIDFSLDKPSLYQMKYKQWGEEGHPNCKKVISSNFKMITIK